MLYGWTTEDFFPLFATYVFGEVMAIVYIIVYIRWTTERSYAWKAIGASFLVVVGSAVYTILGVTGVTGQSSDQVGRITGYMMAVGSVLLYIAPFETLVLVLKTRSGASIPVGMCLAGAISNALWLVDGLLVSDMFIFILSAVCSGLALLQVALFFIFHPSRQTSGTETMQRLSTTEDKCVLPMMTMSSTESNDTAESSLASPVFIAIHSP
ncbi:hypothetical protein BBJ28_00006697 [Nothophytophthora sp. Chile5]|nr:hypothetical protein BBJ28_00006697 [Nothophytophthora sp. Chile5]